jgi:hypothetical protein
MMDRFAQLLAKGKDGALSDEETKELAGLLNAPLFAPCWDPNEGRASKRSASRPVRNSVADMSHLMDQLAAAPLFERVGEPIKHQTVRTLSSWNACLKALNGRNWSDLARRMMNRIWAVAREVRGEDWWGREWNKYVGKRRKSIDARLGPALKRAMGEHDLPLQFMYGVIGDVLMACMLLEFQDAPSQAWSDRGMRWYLAGHVPCGFSGKLPRETATNLDPLPKPSARNQLVVY